MRKKNNFTTRKSCGYEISTTIIIIRKHSLVKSKNNHTYRINNKSALNKAYFQVLLLDYFLKMPIIKTLVFFSILFLS